LGKEERRQKKEAVNNCQNFYTAVYKLQVPSGGNRPYKLLTKFIAALNMVHVFKYTCNVSNNNAVQFYVVEKLILIAGKYLSQTETCFKTFVIAGRRNHADAIDSVAE